MPSLWVLAHDQFTPAARSALDEDIRVNPMNKVNESKRGRKPGVPNKATAAAREAIAMFVDGNAHRLAGWLDEIAAENPQKAFDSFMSVVEYHVPKLARVELGNKDGESFRVTLDNGDGLIL